MLCFKAILLLLATLVLSAYGQNAMCFNREEAEPVYKSLMEKCKEKVPETKENRKEELGLCLLQEMGVMTTTGELDFPKFKNDTLTVIVTKKSEVEQALNECWEASPQDATKAGRFFECYGEKLKTICPEDLNTWMKSEVK